MITVFPKEGIHLRSKNTGKDYYYNPITDTQQYKPFDIQQMISIPDAWDIFYSKNNIPYFKNSLTSKTQFKIPDDSILESKSKCESELTYPITNLSDIDIPTMDKKGTTKKSEYCYILHSNISFSDKRELFCNHNNSTIFDSPICDIQCHNVFLQQLYESFFAKYSLEDIKITYDIVLVHRKIFDGFDKSVLLKEYKKWADAETPYFPVNQKNRNWSKYRKNDILMNITGLSHDPTTILLSGGLLKQLNYALPVSFTTIRDYVFNNILKRLRGYRTNSQETRQISATKQVGIPNFDYDALQFAHSWYKRLAWNHPGRVQCGTIPFQGMYEHSAYKKSIPIECGISGSTNFWIWTALYTKVNLDLTETRMLIFSAFLVLCADGGHSLSEVLSSCVLTSIYWKYYSRFSKDRTLVEYIDGSSFASNLYEVCKDINPIGNEKFICIDWNDVADKIYNTKCTTGCDDKQCPTDKNCIFPTFNDKATPIDKLKTRQMLEAFFLMENNRNKKSFGSYTTFLDQLPKNIDDISNNALHRVIDYTNEFCGKKPKSLPKSNSSVKSKLKVRNDY